eukprot:8429615-Pyramimonas_sp.AAC.1
MLAGRQGSGELWLRSGPSLRRPLSLPSVNLERVNQGLPCPSPNLRSDGVPNISVRGVADEPPREGLLGRNYRQGISTGIPSGMEDHTRRDLKVDLLVHVGRDPHNRNLGGSLGSSGGQSPLHTSPEVPINPERRGLPAREPP